MYQAIIERVKGFKVAAMPCWVADGGEDPLSLFRRRASDSLKMMMRISLFGQLGL
jgi:hypothetical protein